MADVARILSEAGGQRIVFHNETIEEAYASRAAFGAPVWQLGAWVSTYTAIASNAMSKVSNHVEIITGTPPADAERTGYLRYVRATLNAVRSTSDKVCAESSARVAGPGAME